LADTYEYQTAVARRRVVANPLKNCVLTKVSAGDHCSRRGVPAWPCRKAGDISPLVQAQRGVSSNPELRRLCAGTSFLVFYWPSGLHRRAESALFLKTAFALGPVGISPPCLFGSGVESTVQHYRSQWALMIGPLCSALRRRAPSTLVHLSGVIQRCLWCQLATPATPSRWSSLLTWELRRHGTEALVRTPACANHCSRARASMAPGQ